MIGYEISTVVPDGLSCIIRRLGQEMAETYALNFWFQLVQSGIRNPVEALTI